MIVAFLSEMYIIADYSLTNRQLWRAAERKKKMGRLWWRYLNICECIKRDGGGPFYFVDVPVLCYCARNYPIKWGNSVWRRIYGRAFVGRYTRSIQIWTAIFLFQWKLFWILVGNNGCVVKRFLYTLENNWGNLIWCLEKCIT